MTVVLWVDPRLDDCIEEDISMVFWKKSNAQVFFQQKLVNVFLMSRPSEHFSNMSIE